MKRIQRVKGWKKPPNAVNVHRPSVFGNPFAPARIPGWATASRQYAVDDFRNWLNAPDLHYRAFTSGETRNRLVENLHKLEGRDFACWCPLSQPCHADVLLDIVAGHETIKEIPRWVEISLNVSGGTRKTTPGPVAMAG